MSRDAAETYRQRLEGLGLVLPALPEPRGRYSPWKQHGNQLWLSGVTGRTADAPARQGAVGEDVTLEQARDSARLAAANLIAGIVAATHAAEVSDVVFLRGYVRSVGTFDAHPAVIDAASDVIEEVLRTGTHARAAIGVASLPGGACVELEAVIALTESAEPHRSEGTQDDH
jgi:enamine deaminase RidA (YjgF/YER057c/UK114 family)